MTRWISYLHRVVRSCQQKSCQKLQIRKIVLGYITSTSTFRTGKWVETGEGQWRWGWLRVFLVWWQLFSVNMHGCCEWITVLNKRWRDLHFRKPWEGEIWNQIRFHLSLRKSYSLSSISIFDTKNISKYNWEPWFQMEKEVDKWRIFKTQTSIKSKTSINIQPGGSLLIQIPEIFHLPPPSPSSWVVPSLNKYRGNKITEEKGLWDTYSYQICCR